MEENCSPHFPLLPVVVVTNTDTNEQPNSSREMREAERFLMQAIKDKDCQKAEEVLMTSCNEIDFNASLPHNTPLCKAASVGSVDICKLLIDLGPDKVDINQPNSCGETALLLAIKNCQNDIARVLVECGADVNKPAPAGTIATPLFNAVWKGRSDLVTLLVQNGCDVNRGSSRNSPLLMAARLGCVHITKILLEANCDKNWQNRFGVTALYEAVLRGNMKVVRILLEAGCDPNLGDKYGKTPIHVMAQEYFVQACPDNIAILNMLLHESTGCAVHQEDATGELAGDLAIRYKKAWVLSPLMYKGAQLNTKVHRSDALSVALHEGYECIAKILLQAHPCHIIEASTECLFMLSTHQWLTALLIHCGVALPGEVTRALQQNGSLSGLLQKPLSLQQCCRRAVRRHLQLRCLYAVPHLPVPSRIKDFLLFRVTDSPEEDPVESVEETIRLSERRQRNPYFYFHHRNAPYPGYT